MNAWHIYARYYNFGDCALGVGVRNVFCKYSKLNCLFKLVDTHDLEVDEKFVARLNESADLLLVGGGGLLYGPRGRRDRWMFNLPTRLVTTVRVPMIFYSLGYNVFPGQADLGPEALENIRALQEHAVSFSVRNDGSRERLATLGISALEVPDPGFFVDDEYPFPGVPRPYVLLQLANDKPDYRQFDESLLLKGVQQVVRFLIGKEYTVVLAPHTRPDVELCVKLANAIQHPNVRMWDLFHVLRDEHVLAGLSYYKHAAFVMAMRGHAQICPIGMTTPVISILNHAKHRGLLERLDVPSLAVEALDPALGEQARRPCDGS